MTKLVLLSSTFIAVLLLTGCGHPEPSAGVPRPAIADQRRMIEENTALTPDQKRMELARLEAETQTPRNQ